MRRIAAILIPIFLSFPPLIPGQQPAPALMDVAFLDVGQGDSISIRTPTGRNLLIDGGPAKGNNSGADAGRRTLIPFLLSHGARHLDQVIATHPDLDHIGGLISVLKCQALSVGEVLDPGILHTTDYYHEFLKAARDRKGLKYAQPRSGATLDWGEGLSVRVLHPSALTEDTNDCSLVIKAERGKVSFLFTGDTSAAAEEEMVKKWGYRLKATVLKVSHHGSRHASGEEFLRRVRPEVAVISCGKGNPYGHPAPEVLERLKRLGCIIYRTDLQGTITIQTDGQSYSVTTSR